MFDDEKTYSGKRAQLVIEVYVNVLRVLRNTRFDILYAFQIFNLM